MLVIVCGLLYDFPLLLIDVLILLGISYRFNNTPGNFNFIFRIYDASYYNASLPIL
jgi:hypothetical protein